MSTLKAKQFHLIDDMDISAKTFAVIERVEEFSNKTTDIVRTWVRRSNDRRSLARMNEHMLKDIGLNPFEVNQEVGKYFWQK
jgi:uncharacterized protein YjiS (DUF1127 family)